MNAEVQRDIEQRFVLAVVFVGQLAVLEGDRLALGKEGDFDRIFAGGIHRRRSCYLASLFPTSPLLKVYIAKSTFPEASTT